MAGSRLHAVRTTSSKNWKPCGAAALIASNRFSLNPKHNPTDKGEPNARDRRSQEPRAHDNDDDSRVRRADRPGVGDVERPAQAGALVGPADLSGNRGEARPVERRARQLLDDRPRRRPDTRLVEGARPRPAPSP